MISNPRVHPLNVLLPDAVVVDDVDTAKSEAIFLMDAYKTAFSVLDFGDSQYVVMERSRALASAAALTQTAEQFELRGEAGGTH